jgi:undecaprenyl-phosphate 4-deoxy-4-formamido-L-arabinose transferase
MRELYTGVSVVIPLFNSAEILPHLLERLRTTLPEIESQHEIILVDDGSQDDTWKKVEEQLKVNEHIIAFRLMRNYGQHSALLCGIRAARYNITVTMDDDLQHPPEELPKLLDKLEEGFDVVYGTSRERQHSLWRNLASRITRLALQSVMGAETGRNVSAFRAFRTKIREAFATYKSPFVSVDVLLTWGTTRFGAVPVRHDPRHEGESNYTFGRLVAHALDMATGFSNLPLRLASLIGFGFTLFGLGVLAYVLGRYIIEGGSIPGFPFLASIIAIFSGAQLFTIGIIGEYLARVHVRTMDQPDYVVRVVCRSDEVPIAQQDDDSLPPSGGTS